MLNGEPLFLSLPEEYASTFLSAHASSQFLSLLSTHFIFTHASSGILVICAWDVEEVRIARKPNINTKNCFFIVSPY